MAALPHIIVGTGVPRGVCIRFPLGNITGEAFKVQQQRAILVAALLTAHQVQEPGTIVELPYRWRIFQG